VRKDYSVMQPYVRIREEDRDKRRTIADALDVMWQEFGFCDVDGAHIRIGPFRLDSGQCTALVDIVFPNLECMVGLPTSSRFKARSGTSAQHGEFEISRLTGAEIGADGAVLSTDGTRLRGVEVIPTHLPDQLSKREQRIIGHLIRQTGAYHCFRNYRDELPEAFREGCPDLWVLDFGRLCTIDAPPLKVIRGYIEDHEPGLRVSNQKIADTLAMCGIRIPRRRRRAGN
jgi:hypothetical protein